MYMLHLSVHSQIADFGMSRSLDDDSIYYMAENTKFPVRWTAPEVGKWQLCSSSIHDHALHLYYLCMFYILPITVV